MKLLEIKEWDVVVNVETITTVTKSAWGTTALHLTSGERTVLPVPFEEFVKQLRRVCGE